MQIHLPSTLTSPALPPEVQTTPPRGPAAHPFAEMLKQHRAPKETAAAPIAVDPPPAATGEAAGTPSAEPAEPTAPTTAPLRARARGTPAPAPQRSLKTEPAAAREADAAAGPAADDDKRPTVVPADGMALPATSAWPPPAALANDRARAGQGPKGATAEFADAAGPERATRPDAEAARADAHGAHSSERFAAGMTEPAAAPAIDATLLQATAASNDARYGETASSRAEPGAAAPVPGAGGLGAFRPGVGEAPAPVVAQLATAFSAPDFAQAFGLQVSLLAEGGVQQAELHLNPAEMGPVSVTIRMDGTDAQVDFGADTAATRQAIEAGLPELASALREAGFTLTGGGVSEHSQDRHDEAGGGARGERSPITGSGNGVDAARSRPVVTHRVGLGGIDLYA